MGRNKKDDNLIHIGDILGKTLNQFRPAKDTQMLKIWDIWDQAVGSPIAMNAKPESFKDGSLIVNVSSSSWIHQLKFLEKDMIANLNKMIGNNLIRNIRFKIGNIHS